MHNNIKFSIILPTYNRGFRISQCIESVINQNFHDWELIIINDGSTDNTDELVSRYSDDRIKYIKLKKNNGVNIARNQGIKLVNGEFTLLLDSDNFLLENILSKYNDLTTTSKYDYFKFPCINQDGKHTVDDPNFLGNLSYKLFLTETKKGEYATLIKSKLLKDNKFFEDINGGEGITWKLIAKQLQVIRYEPIIALIYDNIGNDRLSLKNKNYHRLAKVFIKDIQILGFDYLRYAPFFLLKNIIKLIIYKILSILKK